MSQARGSVVFAEGTVGSSTYRKNDDDRKKSQAQRLLEFEMWTNDRTLRDLEYSQRRTEKKQRKRERRLDARNRRWKKLYVPGVLGMVGGTFLTLCGTLQSLGGDTFFWDVRQTLTIAGPVLLALGFLCLLLAAGCTFQHDQTLRERPKAPPSEFDLLFSGVEFRERYRGGNVTRRSVSLDTGDMPVPDDLDPQKNFVSGKTLLGRDRNRSVRSNASTGSTAFLVPPVTASAVPSSYASIESWVQSVSASHTQRLAGLTRQHSDSNLVTSVALCSCGDCHFTDTQKDEELGESQSQNDLHVVCTRSLTSSGYQSAGDSPTSVANYRIFVDTKGPDGKSTVAKTISAPPARNHHCLSDNGTVTKTFVMNSRRRGMRKYSLDSKTRQKGCAGFAGRAAIHSAQDSSSCKKQILTRKPSSSTAGHKDPVTETFYVNKASSFLLQGKNLSRDHCISELPISDCNAPVPNGVVRKLSLKEVALDVGCGPLETNASISCETRSLVPESVSALPGSLRCTPA